MPREKNPDLKTHKTEHTLVHIKGLLRVNQ